MIELQVKTNFSFLRGASHPEELIEQAAKLGYSAIGICDLNTLAGVVRAHSAAKKFGVRLVAGAQLALYREIPKRLEDEEIVPPEALIGRWENLLDPVSVIVYPISRAGYASLSQLLTLGKSRAPKGCCYLLLEDVLQNLKECVLIASLSDPFHETVLQSLLLLQANTERFSLAVKNNYGPDQRRCFEKIVTLGRELNIPLIATNDVYFHVPERKPLQDVVACIRRGCQLDEAGFELFQNGERFLKPPEEMKRLFRELPEAIERSELIAEQTREFSLDQLKYEYPREICPEGMEPLEYLKKLTWIGAKSRYPKGVPAAAIKQLQNEMRLIEELDYAKYFLTVYDIVRFANSQKILCQGRGAAANSLVCYCLGITSVSPEEISLLFERFISKERNEPPDIDIDFEHERREEVIQYIYEKYGRHRAAIIAEVICYRTKSAVRDVGKVFGLDLETVERLLKTLHRFDESKSLEAQLCEFELDPSDIRIHQVLALSKELKGFPRHLSQHVGGFVISEVPLGNLVPIENASMKDRTVIEWDKDDVDAMGMLKIDCLALGMLTCIRKCFDLINKLENRSDETALALYKVPREDSLVYDMICKADTIGVFQIESRAQMAMLPRLRPRCFYDLVVEVAIVRPGPIQGGMVHPYLRRRMGRERFKLPNKEIERVLGRTLGVPIFQEQAMELTVVAAGFTPGEADELRRSMASWKRNKNVMGKFKEKIIAGMKAKGYEEEFAQQCVRQIEGFGEYGFPQSHSASFAHLAYVSAWLKKYYPEAFCAALINSQPMGFYHPSQLIQDAERHGVEIKPIDLNFSGWDCHLEKRNTMRAGMCLVRGLAEEKAQQLAKIVKSHGPFSSITELWRKSRAHPSTLRALARADAYQSFGLSRQRVQWELQRLKDHSLPLLEQLEAKEDDAELPALTREGEMCGDYLSAGFSLKAHPMAFLREELNARRVVTAKMIKESIKDGAKISFAGIVVIRQRPPTAKGFIFLTMEDETGPANVIVKPNIYPLYRDILYDSIYLLIHGRLQNQDGVIHLMTEAAENLRPAADDSVDIVRNFY